MSNNAGKNENSLKAFLNEGKDEKIITRRVARSLKKNTISVPEEVVCSDLKEIFHTIKAYEFTKERCSYCPGYP